MSHLGLISYCSCLFILCFFFLAFNICSIILLKAVHAVEYKIYWGEPDFSKRILSWTVFNVYWRYQRFQILPMSLFLSLLLALGLPFASFLREFLVALVVKKLPAMWENRVQSLGWEFPWRRERQPFIFLPGGVHGHRNLVGYSLWDCKELDMTEQLTCNK